MSKNSELEKGLPPVSTVGPRRRRLLRFGLRTLLIVAFVVSIPLAFVGRELYRLRQEAAATEALLSVGAGIAFDHQRNAEGTWVSNPPPPPDPYGLTWLLGERFFARPVQVSLSSDDGAEDGHMALLPRLSKLERIRLHGTSFTDAAIEPLGRCRTLKKLSLHDTRISGEAFAQLANREQIEELNFSGSSDDESLDAILGVGALSNLEYLTLNHPYLTRRRLQAIAELTRLQQLFLAEPTGVEPGAFRELAALDSLTTLTFASPERAPMDDADLAAIGDMESLEWLNFDGESMTDAGLESLTGAKRLLNLNFRSLKITDAGLESLATLPMLERLYVIAPNVTDAGIEALTGMTTLEEFGCTESRMTDASLAALGRLPNLKRLVLDASISEAAAAKFAAEHPQCDVHLNVNGRHQWIPPVAASNETTLPDDAASELADP